MIVYLESNFILTLALQQDDFAPAAEILDLGRAGTIELRVPVFSLSEPLATVTYRGNARARLLAELRNEVRELTRLQQYRSVADQLGQGVIQLERIREEQMESLAMVIADIAACARLIGIDATLLSQAKLPRSAYGMGHADAIVFASITSDLDRTPTRADSVFISTNYKDFELPGIQEELRALRCRYIADFSNGLNFINAAIAR